MRGAAPLPGPSPTESLPADSPTPSAASACHTTNAKLARCGKPVLPACSTAADHKRSGIGKQALCAPPPFETPENLPYAVRDIRRFSIHRRSSGPLCRVGERPTLAAWVRSSHAGRPKGRGSLTSTNKQLGTSGLLTAQKLAGRPENLRGSTLVNGAGCESCIEGSSSITKTRGAASLMSYG